MLDPGRTYYDHLGAAKAFTALKHDARALRETFGPSMDERSLAGAVQLLHDRYNALVMVVPPTNDKAMKKAQARIQSGIHEPDRHPA